MRQDTFAKNAEQPVAIVALVKSLYDAANNKHGKVLVVKDDLSIVFVTMQMVLKKEKQHVDANNILMQAEYLIKNLL